MRKALASFAALLALPIACGGGSAAPGDAGQPAVPPTGDTGAPAAQTRVFRVGPEVGPRSAGDDETTRRISEKLAEVQSLTAEQFAARYPTSFATAIGYDATSATHMDRIQASALRLNDGELAMLKERGFVVTDRNRYPNFTYGYRTIYAEHLPLYVSADSILEAVHRSYDDILKGLEMAALRSAVSSLLEGAHGALSALPAGDARADLNLYFSVARSLLANVNYRPALGGDGALFDAIMAAATSASGLVEVSLFGSQRAEDFSQYVPRGHYTGGLEGYFKAMMWLGRTDFRFLETQADGSQILRRRQVIAAFALRELLDRARLDTYRTVDDTLRAFVGDQDYLTIDQLAPVGAMLGIAAHSDLDRLSDDELAAGLRQVSFGQQRIASHIMQGGTTNVTFPLSLSFAFFGQRYVLDSHVFSLLVYDRVPKRLGVPLRLMPQTFDVAFAALANDHAGALLAPELTMYEYAPFLATARIVADEHGGAYWQSNLYNLWLSALRGLSPASDLGTNDAAGLFTVARTEPWGRRILNAQLASWSELRHDTILYSKQSYTGVPVCEFPDAYVDPYPKFYAAIEALAARGRETIARVPFQYPIQRDGFAAYFARLGSAAGMLRQMAEAELAGAQFTAAQLEFINQAVALRSGVCTSQPTGATGWYPALYYSDARSIQRDPVIADVHTQPADRWGNPVGRVLHVATGDPRQMVVTTDTCGGPRAYVGLASSYFEQITEGFVRLTDAEWAKSINAANPPDLPWVTDWVAR